MKHRRMNGYSEDPGYPEPTTFETLTKAQATRTFDVSLSSVKRYANKVHRRESLAPKKSPGSASKLDQGARQLLAEDLTLRPYATLAQRCDYMEAMRGCSVSRSTMCRAIARIGSARKKGTICHRRRRVRKSSLAGDGYSTGIARVAGLCR